MSHVQHSVRLPLALDKALRQAAKSRGTTSYALLQQSVRLGLAAINDPTTEAEARKEITREIGELASWLARIERLAERSLYVATAAYAYARASAGPQADDANIAQEISEAFARQMRLAGEER